MIAFGWVTNMLQRGMASWKRMLEVLDTPPAIHDKQPQSPPNTLSQSFSAASASSAVASIRGDIEFRDLVFGYDGAPVLDHVSARIEAGPDRRARRRHRSGKSTLISLLARLHDPPPGTVFIDGVDVREMPLATLRGAIGFVPQEPFLFSDTLADNVAFGLDAIAGPDEPGDRRRQRIADAAAVARLDKDVADFPKGYDTLVGERGITLSGGQKQRTALARHRHRSADPDSRRRVVGRRHLHGRRDSLAPARRHAPADLDHRVAPHFDRSRRRPRLRARPGRIVERGTHDELIRRGGTLRRAAQEAAPGGGAGRVVSALHEEDVLGKAYDARLMGRLLAFLRPYWRQVAIALVAIIAGAGAQLAQPYLIKTAIDRYIAAGRLAGLDRLAALYF